MASRPLRRLLYSRCQVSVGFATRLTWKLVSPLGLGHLRGVRSPRPHVLNDLAVEADGLLHGLSNERTFGPTALAPHRARHGHRQLSGFALRISRGQQSLGLVPQFTQQERGCLSGSAEADLDPGIRWRVPQLTAQPGDARERPAVAWGGNTDSGRDLLSTQIGFDMKVAHGVRNSQVTDQAPALTQLLGRGLDSGIRRGSTRPERSDIATEILAQAEGDVLDELLPPDRDVSDLDISPTRCSGTDGVAHGNPLVPHVPKPTRS